VARPVNSISKGNSAATAGSALIRLAIWLGTAVCHECVAIVLMAIAQRLLCFSMSKRRCL